MTHEETIRAIVASAKECKAAGCPLHIWLRMIGRPDWRYGFPELWHDIAPVGLLPTESAETRQRFKQQRDEFESMLRRPIL